MKPTDSDKNPDLTKSWLNILRESFKYTKREQGELKKRKKRERR